ncbi:MAG: SH3 domain-containing protein [Clostridia bacterium]|nr:SH3 domain-containing protein [Clostridia bacterium]
MKRAILLALALLLCAGLALAEKPDYSVSGNVLNYDFDKDGVKEQIELTVSNDWQAGYVTLNVSRNNVVQSHFQILSFDTTAGQPETQLKLFPFVYGGENLLYVETHVAGAENVYSMWYVVSFKYNTINFHAFMYDPGWSSGVALYAGSDPVDSQTYMLYTADYSNYSGQDYLKAMGNRFSAYGITFRMEQLPFKGWYSAAVLDVLPNGEYALNLSHFKLNTVTTTTGSGSSGGGSSSSAKSSTPSGALTINITGKVNVRTNYNTKASIVTVLSKGASVPYDGRTCFDERGVAWHYVKTSVGYGWVSSKYARNAVLDAVIPKTAPKGTVETTASLNVRGGPSLNDYTVAQLKKGAKLTFLGEIETDDRNVPWFKVDYNGYTAWVSSKYSSLK